MAQRTEEPHDKPPRGPQRQALSESLVGLVEAVDQIHEDLVTEGSVDSSRHRYLQQQLATVIFQVRQYRNHEGLDWEGRTPFDGGPDELLELMFAGDVQEERATGRRNGKSQTVRKAKLIEPLALYKSAQDMLDVARDLGLTPPVDQSTENIYPDPV